jgi:hypothetical protein
MLSFSEYIIDKTLLELPMELQESFISSIIGKLNKHEQDSVNKRILKVNASRDPYELDKHADDNHFAVRLAVARHPKASVMTLKRLKDNNSEYRSVSSAAEANLMTINS